VTFSDRYRASRHALSAYLSGPSDRMRSKPTQRLIPRATAPWCSVGVAIDGDLHGQLCGDLPLGAGESL